MNEFEALSAAITATVERAAQGVVRVDARPRQSASGVLWSTSGIVVTADHVVEQDAEIKVGLPDGRVVAATLLGRDAIHDIAVLRLAESAGPVATIAESAELKVGALVLAVARPGSEGVQADASVISAVSGPVRTRRGGVLGGVVRTGIAMYPGFSGGALVDASGKILGILSSHLGSDAGMAIPAHVVTAVVTNILQHGHVRRAFLGFRSQQVPLAPDLAAKLPSAQSHGLLVVSVESDSPALRGGVLIGDIVVGFAGAPLQSTDDLQALLTGDRIGVETPLAVLRGGVPTTLTVLPAERS